MTLFKLDFIVYFDVWLGEDELEDSSRLAFNLVIIYNCIY